jgi:hypothetical protein
VALNFGDHASPALTPCAVIDNGQAGYSETGTWNTVVGGFNGTNRNSRTVQHGNPTATATWDFTGLSTNFTYDVYVTFGTKSGYSKAAPFTVYDGGTSLGTQHLNESILVTSSSQPQTQGSYGSVGWLEIDAALLISSGELKVVLNNLSSGNFVDADGVLLVCHPISGSPHGATVSTTTSSNTSAPTDVAVGVVNVKDKSTTNGAPATISLNGVSSPSNLNVIYNGTAPVVNQDSPSAVDTVLGLGLSTKKNGTNNLIATLAQDLLSGKKQA